MPGCGEAARRALEKVALLISIDASEDDMGILEQFVGLLPRLLGAFDRRPGADVPSAPSPTKFEYRL